MNKTGSTSSTGLESRTVVDGSRTVAESATPANAMPVPEIRDHELIRRIGQGSYGDVWLARNVMGTYRAVKIVYRAAFEHARPFEREFNGIQKFEPLSRSHDGFVDILQIGRTDEYFYYVMELADDVAAGQQIDANRYEPKTLRSQVQGKKPLPFEQCVELGLSLTQALDKLHSHGLIHRDIKPSNIIFVNGQPKLADIGLVAEQSEAKSFVGTEGFIPPEGPGSPQADIYSLGKVLYEITTGKDRHEFPALPTLLGDSMTDTNLLELNTVVLKACQSDLKQRYQTCGQMRDDLLLLQSGKSVKRAQALERRVAIFARLTALGIAFTILVLGGLFFFQRQAKREAMLRGEADAQRQRADSKAAELRQHLYAADMNVAAHALEDGNLGRAKELIETYFQPELRSLRGFEWQDLWQRCQSDESFSFPPHAPYAATALAFSPKGDVLGTAGFDGTVRLWDLQTRRLLRPPLTRRDEIQRRAIAFSPDGTIFAARDYYGITLWNPANWDKIRNLEDSTGNWDFNCSPVMFSHDDQMLVAPVRSGVRFWDTKTWRETFLISDGRPGFGDQLAFSPDDNVLAIADFARIQLWNMRTRTLAATMPGDLGRSRALAFSPVTNLLASGWDDGQVKLWDGITGRELATLDAHKRWTYGLAFAPDGRTLVTGGADQVLRVWDIEALALMRASQETAIVPMSAARAVLQGHEGQIWELAFSPDGYTVASACKDGTVKLWDVRPKLEQSQFTGAQTPLWFSTDGKQLLACHFDNTLHLWDVAERKEIRKVELPINGAEVQAQAVSVDGQTLAVATTNGIVELWDLSSHKRTDVLTGHKDPIQRLGFSPHTQRLAVSDGFGVRVWNLQTHRSEVWEPGSDFPPFAFSPNDERLALVHPLGPIKLWDLRTQQSSEFRLPAKFRRTAVAFSPNGKWIAVASHDNTPWILASSDGKELHILKGHLTGVVALDFSPDGRSLASYGTDQTVKLWNVLTGKELFTRLAFNVAAARGPLSISTVRFSPAGNALAVSSPDRTAPMYLWLVPPLNRIETIEAAAREAEFSAKHFLNELERDQAKRIEGQRLVTRDDEGAIKHWLVLAPIPLAQGESGSAGLDRQQIDGEADLHPKTGEKVVVGETTFMCKEAHLTDYTLDLIQFLGKQSDNSVAYAVCYIIADKEQAGLKMKVGSDDQAAIYLNSQQVYRNHDGHPFTLDDDEISDLRFHAGLNVVVFKIVNGTFAWKGSLRFTDESGRPVKGIRVSLSP